jgi:hypothetical protein
VLVRAPQAAVDVGRLPTSELSLGGGLGIRSGAWHASVVGRIFKGQTLWASSLPDVGVQVTHVAAELSGCRALSAAPFEFSPCLTLGLDRFTARGTGPNITASPEGLWVLAPGAALAAHLHIFDWLALYTQAGASYAPAQPRFQIQGIGDIAELGRMRGSFAVGSEWIF